MGRTAGSATGKGFPIATECQPGEGHDRARPGQTDAALADNVEAAPHRLTGGSRPGGRSRARSPIAASLKGLLPTTSEPNCRIGGAGLQPGVTGPDSRVAGVAPSAPGHEDAPGSREIRGRELAGQEALGLADMSGSVETDGSLDIMSLAAGEAGVTEVGLVVAAGVVHARTAPPSEAARVRASRIRLYMVGKSSVHGGAGGSGHLIRGLAGHVGTDLTEGPRTPE